MDDAKELRGFCFADIGHPSGDNSRPWTLRAIAAHFGVTTIRLRQMAIQHFQREWGGQCPCVACGGFFPWLGMRVPIGSDDNDDPRDGWWWCKSCMELRYPETVRRASKRRRARVVTQSGGDPFDLKKVREEVAERDGWTCYLCTAPVTRKDWAIDHVVPLDKGGAHAIENLRLTHRRCNSRKGNRDVAPGAYASDC